MNPRLPLVLVCALLAAALLPAACTAPTPVSPANLPDDFALGITVLPIPPARADQGSDSPDQARTPSPALEPAWYILGPDDILHAATGERLPTSTMPLAVRILSREQVKHIWELVATGGLAAPTVPGTLVPESQVATLGASAIVFVAAEGHRHSFAVLAGTQTAAEVSRVVMELRTLGWIPDPPQPPAPKPRSQAPKDEDPNLSK